MSLNINKKMVRIYFLSFLHFPKFPFFLQKSTEIAIFFFSFSLKIIPSSFLNFLSFLFHSHDFFPFLFLFPQNFQIRFSTTYPNSHRCTPEAEPSAGAERMEDEIATVGKSIEG